MKIVLGPDPNVFTEVTAKEAAEHISDWLSSGRSAHGDFDAPLVEWKKKGITKLLSLCSNDEKVAVFRSWVADITIGSDELMGAVPENEVEEVAKICGVAGKIIPSRFVED